MSHTNFYVYHWLREDGTPYYVGKGQTNRAFEKRRKYRPPLNRIKLIKENLTEKQAFDLEVKEILKYGRKDLGTGILRNKTEGGDGHVPGPETRLKLSKVLKGKNKGKTPWNKGLKGVQTSTRKGVPRSEEEKKRISIATKIGMKKYYENRKSV